MNPLEKTEILPGRGEGTSATVELDPASGRGADPKRKTPFRTAIEASTARIVSIALTRGIDMDPEAA